MSSLKTTELQQKLTTFAMHKFGEKTGTDVLIQWLAENGILQPAYILRYLVKYEYQNLVKIRKNIKLRDVRLKLAEQYGIFWK